MQNARRRQVVTTAATIVSLACAAAAGASPVVDGKLVLRPDRDAVRGLGGMGISVALTGRALASSVGPVFPIAGAGHIDEGLHGALVTAGGLRFSSDGAEVTFSKFVLRLRGETAKLIATAKHSDVRFFDLDLSDATVHRTETRFGIKGADATLAKPGAEVLSETFSFGFEKGGPAGTVNIRAQRGTDPG
jgi:hypothetical protein